MVLATTNASDPFKQCYCIWSGEEGAGFTTLYFA